MVEIPVHRARDAIGKIDMAAFAEFSLKLGRIDGVTMVVAGTVGDEGDQRTAGLAGGGRAGWKTGGQSRVGGKGAVDGVADQADDVAVVALVAAADVVGLADT